MVVASRSYCPEAAKVCFNVSFKRFSSMNSMEYEREDDACKVSLYLYRSLYPGIVIWLLILLGWILFLCGFPLTHHSWLKLLPPKQSQKQLTRAAAHRRSKNKLRIGKKKTEEEVDKLYKAFNRAFAFHCELKKEIEISQKHSIEEDSIVEASLLVLRLLSYFVVAAENVSESDSFFAQSEGALVFIFNSFLDWLSQLKDKKESAADVSKVLVGQLAI